MSEGENICPECMAKINKTNEDLVKARRDILILFVNMLEFYKEFSDDALLDFEDLKKPYKFIKCIEKDLYGLIALINHECYIKSLLPYYKQGEPEPTIKTVELKDALVARKIKGNANDLCSFEEVEDVISNFKESE